MVSERRVEFSTADGTKLRGVLFLPDKKNAPAVIITSGFTFLKEHFMVKVAREFSAAGIAALAYDHRSWGSSDGLPRQHINLYTQAFDWSDAVTFLIDQSPDVDPKRIGILGAGHGGGVAMQVAATDDRVKVAVFALPFFSGFHDSQFWPKGHAEKLLEEKVQSAKSAGKQPPIYIPIFHDSLDDSRKDPSTRLIGGPGPFEFYQEVKKMSDDAGTPWENKVTLDSLRYQRIWEPSVYLPQIDKPILWVMGKKDEFTPFDMQEKAFETIKSSKKQALKIDSGNLEAFQTLSIFGSVVKGEVEFLTANL